MRLNLGCGRNPLDGYVNLDMATLPGVDVVFDLESCATVPLPFADDTFAEIVGIDLIEHITKPLPLMQELWRVAKPGATCTFLLPYGSSDDAWEDPTHVRPYFLNSWIYFAQPTYFRADYGYRGDWQADHIVLDVTCDGTPAEIQVRVMELRNQVARQTVQLSAVKPAREPKRELMQPARLMFNRV